MRGQVGRVTRCCRGNNLITTKHLAARNIASQAAGSTIGQSMGCNGYPRVSRACSAISSFINIGSIYKEIGPGTRVALAKLAVEKFEETGRPLRIAIDTSIWLFQIQASKGGLLRHTRNTRG